MSSLENDMICLIESLQYLKDDTRQQVQALEHLADMCLNEKGAQLFQKTNGLSVVYKMAFDNNTSPLVLQKALLTLGNATLINDENKSTVCSDEMLKKIEGTMLNEDANQKLIASATYLLACLCSCNEKIQNKTRKLRIVEKLVSLYRVFHPKGETEGVVVEQWFEKVDRQSPVMINHISHALKSMMNKPRNDENQVLCSRLLNLALSTILSSQTNNSSKSEALHFIAECVFENDKTQRIFNMIGGVRYLGTVLKNQVQNIKAGKDANDLLVCVLDTISVAITDCEDSKTLGMEAGIIQSLVECLRKPVENVVQLKCMIILSEFVHSHEKSQKALLESDGIPIVIHLMATEKEDLVSKVGTSILQCCVSTFADLDAKHPELSASNLITFINKTKKTEKSEPKKTSRKSLKTLLRSLEMNDVNADVKRELLNVMSESNKSAPRKNLRGCENAVLKKAKKTGDEEVLKMLQEQKDMLAHFQSDFQNLRDELKSQVSDCGDSNATPVRKLARNFICPSSLPPQRKCLPLVMCSRSLTPSNKPYNFPVSEDNRMRVQQRNSREFMGDERPALVDMGDYTYENNGFYGNRGPSLDVIHKVQQWRELCPQEDSVEQFKVPVCTPMLSKKRVHQKTSQIHDFRPIQHAPKKLLPCKRKRPESPLQGFTPERHIFSAEKLKRTLDFTRFATEQRKIDWSEEKISESSGYFGSKNLSEEYTVAKSNACLGCQPFARLPLLLRVTSQKLRDYILKDTYTCLFHKEMFDNLEDWYASDERKSQPSKPAAAEKFRSVFKEPVGVTNNWDSMSVFSFRSESMRDGDARSQCSNCTSTTVRRHRKEYSKEEISFILEGVDRYGTRWNAILNSYPFKAGRQAVDLSGKYKQMKKQNMVKRSSASLAMKSHLSFTTQELVNLKTGVYECGEDWDAILMTYDFHSKRTANELKENWEALVRR